MKQKDGNSILHAFEDLTKEDLIRLRKMSDYPIKSNLNKAELVDALVDNFKKDPVKLLMQLPIYDIELLSELCRTKREWCITCDEFPDLLYIQEFNICEYDYNDNGHTQDIWLTDEMRDLISPFIEQVEKDIENSGRHIVEFLFWGMIWIYGYLPAKDMINAIQKEFGTKEEEWWPIYDRLVKYFPFTDCFRTPTMLIHPAIGDIEHHLEERSSRGFDSKPLKEYSFDDFIKVGATGPYFFYGEKTPEYKKAISALKKCGCDDVQAPTRLSMMWREVQDIDGYNRPTDIFKRAVGENPPIASTKVLGEITDAIFTYMNNLPRWSLGGRVPTEIETTPEQRNQLASFMAAMDKVSEHMSTFQKVGRNDPCPCGSGLKYKNCHGKNIS